MLSEYGQRLRIFPSIKTAQIFSGFQNKVIFFGKLRDEVPQNLSFPTLKSGTVRVLSGFANFTSKATVYMLFVSKMSRFLVDFKFFQR